MTELKTITAAELLETSPTARACIASQLETAARMIRDGNRDESAAWRLADAGLEFRRLMERNGERGIVGVHFATGMGAILPREPRK